MVHGWTPEAENSMLASSSHDGLSGNQGVGQCPSSVPSCIQSFLQPCHKLPLLWLVVFQFGLLSMNISQLLCQCYHKSALFLLNPDLAALFGHHSTYVCHPPILHSAELQSSAKLRNEETGLDGIEWWQAPRSPEFQCQTWPFPALRHWTTQNLSELYFPIIFLN